MSKEILFISKRLNYFKQELRKASSKGISMHNRLFLLLALLVIILVLGVFMLSLLTGVFSTGLAENRKLVQNEFAHITQDVLEQFSGLSAQAVELSAGLSESIEGSLERQGLTSSDLQQHPEVLEKIIGDVYERILFSLQKAKSSGIFVILDATVNPDLEDSEVSRAGLYLKNMEPNIINSAAPTIVALRGFPNIARQNSLPLHAQWAMEFDISDAPYYRLPMEQAASKRIPLTRLYYWSPAFTLPGTSEEVMLCSIPLIDSRGNVFGICGFEVSAMLFKLSHMPDNRVYDRTFCLLTPVSDHKLNITQALFAGGYSAQKLDFLEQSLQTIENTDSYNIYHQNEDIAFAGFHTEIQLYPKGAPFSEQEWAVALMIPQQDITSSVIQNNLRLARLCLLLIIAGMIISFFISKRYIKQISEGLDIIKSNNLQQAPKTKITEIDNLIESLTVNRKEHHNNAVSELPSPVFEEFLKNIKSLSPAERAVFDLYAQGYTAKEITNILCLSINTVKTHSRRIYMKLNVASRDELLNFIRILEDMGKDVTQTEDG